MRIPYKTRLLLAISSISALLIAGCVDTSVNPIPDSIVYYSQMKVVNLVQGAGQATLSLNGESLGTAAFGGEAPGDFLQVPSGSKTLAASFASAPNNTYKFSATTDRKFRVFLVGDAAKNSAVIMTQRYVWQTKDSNEGAALFPDGYGWVAFFNGSPDAVVNSVNIGGDVTTFTDGLVMGKGNGYLKVAAGSYDISFNITFKFAVNDSTEIDSTMNTTPFNYTIGSKSRYTTVLYDSATTLQSAVLVDD